MENNSTGECENIMCLILSGLHLAVSQHVLIPHLCYIRAETESDSGFRGLESIPAFQRLGIDSDQFLGILEMIHEGFTQVWGKFSRFC